MDIIIQKLGDLHQAATNLAQVRADYDAKRNAILAALAPELAALDEEFGPQIAHCEAQAQTLDAEARALVLAHGASVKAEHVHAVYTKGRVTWDSKLLDGFAIAHPEIKAARKEGEPSVSLRVIASQ